MMKAARSVVFLAGYFVVGVLVMYAVASVVGVPPQWVGIPLALVMILLMDRIAGLFGIPAPPPEDPKPLPLDHVHDHLDNRRRY